MWKRLPERWSSSVFDLWSNLLFCCFCVFIVAAGKREVGEPRHCRPDLFVWCLNCFHYSCFRFELEFRCWWVTWLCREDINAAVEKQTLAPSSPTSLVLKHIWTSPCWFRITEFCILTPSSVTHWQDYWKAVMSKFTKQQMLTLVAYIRRESLRTTYDHLLRLTIQSFISFNCSFGDPPNLLCGNSTRKLIKWCSESRFVVQTRR